SYASIVTGGDGVLYTRTMEGMAGGVLDGRRQAASAGGRRPGKRFHKKLECDVNKQRSLGDILQEFRQHRLLMQQELQKIIVGQSEVIEQLLAAVFTRGHCLLE